MQIRSMHLPMCVLALALQNAWAQPAPVPAPTAQGAAQAAEPMSSITVKGKLARQPKTDIIRRLNRNLASSCAYSIEGFADPLVDNYLKSFHGEEYGEGTIGRDPNLAHTEAVRQALAEGLKPDINAEVANDTPFSESNVFGGDVSRTPDENARFARDYSDEYRKSLCGPSDRMAEAGRHAIARKDRSFQRGMDAYESKDYAVAMEQFLINWDKLGWPDAGLTIALMHLRGEGVPADPKKAAQWLDKVALQRPAEFDYVEWNPQRPEMQSAQVEATLRLADLYLTGQGVARDPKRAFALIERAVDLDYVPARVTLANMLMAGVGTAKDPKRALKHYQAAAEAGYAQAQYALAQLFASGEAGTPDLAQAFAWYQQAAMNRNNTSRKSWAEFELGRMIEEGRGTTAAPKQALEYYRRAAIAGHPGAQNLLGIHFYHGRLVAKDVRIAQRLFQASAAQGHADAMFNLAAMLFRGESGSKDVFMAYTWLRLADRMGQAQAGKLTPVLAAQLSPEERSKADLALAPLGASSSGAVGN